MDNLSFQTIKNKKKYAYIIVGFILAVVGVIFIISFMKAHSTENEDLLADQKVEGLAFKKANLESKNGETEFSVEIYNETDDDINLKNIYVMITIDDKEYKLVGYVGNKIKANDLKYLNTKIDKDLKDATSIRYIINK